MVITTGCKTKRATMASTDKEAVAVISPDTIVAVGTSDVDTLPIVDVPQEEVIERQDESKTPVEKVKSQEEFLFENLLAAQGSWNTMVVKGSVSMGAITSSFEMRMINNESLQISLRPIFGIEVARVVVTTDSLYLYDKLNKRYVIESIKTFSDKIPFEPTICDLQNALLGRPFILGHASLTAEDFDEFYYETAGQDWAMQPLELPEGIIYMFGMNKDLLVCALAQQTTNQRQMRCDYREHDKFSGRIIPSHLVLTARLGEKSYSININYTSISWDTPTSVQKLSTVGLNKTTVSKVVNSLMK